MLSRRNLCWLLVSLLLMTSAACGSRSRIPTQTAQPADGDQLVLVARVKTALLNDPIVGKRRIDVHVTGGQVRLAGRVATIEERDRAVSLARAVQGVLGVTSDLEIRP
jgi:hyperosmotically inducible protein